MGQLTKAETIKAFNESSKNRNTLQNVGGATETPTGTPSIPADSNKDNETTIQAQAANTTEKRKADEAQRLKEEIARKQAEEAKADILQKAGIRAGEAVGAIGDITAPARSWIEHLPTPGGIATIIGLLIFFIFVAMPVNAQGDTRLKLLFLTLTGKTHLGWEDRAVQKGSIMASGDFGGPNNVITPIGTVGASGNFGGGGGSPELRANPVDTSSLNGINFFGLLGLE